MAKKAAEPLPTASVANDGTEKKRSTLYGPHNPHPLSQLRTELVWEGKYDEFGNRREVNIGGFAMPLQKIETIDEPRSRAEAQGSLFDEKKAHRDDFRNRLIWGDNKLVMASLLSEFKGAIELIYIDPPFDVGADFTMKISVGEDNDKIDKDQSIIEMVAYRDTWGKGLSSYSQMMYERISVMKQLLSDNGNIFVHCDWRVVSYLKLILDDVFGKECFRNEIIWQHQQIGTPRTNPSRFAKAHETIIWYSARPQGFIFNYQDPAVKVPWSDDTKKSMKQDEDGKWYYERRRTGTDNPWAYDPRFLRTYVDDPEAGKTASDVWSDMPSYQPANSEKTGYNTQKPDDLIKRVIAGFSNPDGIVFDGFCGSGTTAAVAERLGRKWIVCDLGRFAIHTSRKRLIGIQRELNDEGKVYRSFDLYNLGRYERQWWQQESLKGAEEEHRTVVLNFFRAEILGHAPSPLLHGRKGTAFVHVDGIDSIFTRGELSEVSRAVKAAGGKQVHCLAWDFEMDIRQSVAAVESELGVSIKLHRIPREIMEKNRTEVPPFFEVALLEAESVVRKAEKGKGKTVDIKLTNFLPSLTEVPGKELEALQERAVENGFDFIDFWAVDFDWRPGKPFNHHWQDYRTRKDRTLKTVSDAGFVYERSGKHTACVKVVDVFGCDTSITVEVEV